MPLQRLSVTQLRNLRTVEIQPSPEINLISGANGSGKTSLLEAIYLLGRGRSFRSSQAAGLVTRGADEIVVFGSVTPGEKRGTAPVSVGISKSLSGESQIRIGGQNAPAAANLAALLPVQLINPDSFELLNGGPKGRRQFMDWGVFHVEQSFYEVWRKLTRSLKQRNKLLRHATIDRTSLAVWDKEFAIYAQQLTELRKAYIEKLKPVFKEVLHQLSGLEDVPFSFYAGWDQNKPLAELLAAGFSRDAAAGFTHLGPQRADLHLRYLGQNARDTLSRGQQKLVVSALKIAQASLLARERGQHCVFLVDDLAAELDSQHRRKLCELLGQLECQLFITSVESEVYADCWGDKAIKMFHVEQGAVVEC